MRRKLPESTPPSEEVYNAVRHQIARGLVVVCSHCKKMSSSKIRTCPYCHTPLPERSDVSECPVERRPSLAEREGVRLDAWEIGPSRRALEAVGREDN